MFNPLVRHYIHDGSGYEYGGPIKYGVNEILFDTFLPWWGFESGKENSTARLPNIRVLFSITMNFIMR